jgi:hypothetical protein
VGDEVTRFGSDRYPGHSATKLCDFGVTSKSVTCCCLKELVSGTWVPFWNNKFALAAKTVQFVQRPSVSFAVKPKECGSGCVASGPKMARFLGSVS